jgi:SpoVK/Ycf46/Vps4 family AAA+-type ATPase
MAEPYHNSLEHLKDELALLDLLLHREVVRSRPPRDAQGPQLFGGVYVSDEEVEALLGRGAGADTSEAGARAAALDAAAAALAEEVAARRLASLEAGTHLTLAHLTHLFGLSPFEERVVVACLALEIDLKYEKLFAYLQDDLTRKRPSVELLLRLFCADDAERLRARNLFAPQATLTRARLLRAVEQPDAPALARLLALDERVVNHLLETGGLDAETSRLCKLFAPGDGAAPATHRPELLAHLAGLARGHLRGTEEPPRKLFFHLVGPAGAGRRSLARAVCAELGVPLMIVDVRRALAGESGSAETFVRLAREAILQPAALYLEEFEALGERGDADALRRDVVAALEEYSWLTFVATEKTFEPAGLFGRHHVLRHELPMPDARESARLWPELAGVQGGAAVEGADWAALAAKFRLTPGQMKDALTAARNYAHARGGRGEAVGERDLYRGCRAQSNQKLAELARRLARGQSWDDLILPADSVAQLRELCAQMRHRGVVYDVWGFGRRPSARKGLCALFYGPSGTGKTMAVEVVAGELQLDAFKIDLSTVVSKYIGETEKNLSRIFHEAETSNAILFFDEADALFGKRSEVKDAHDRYANIEINYLLQRVEEFDGMVVLATNLRKNIDEAFFRRMSFAVEFPFPEEADRYRIWRRHFPADAPLSEDVDFNFLAGRVNVAGGNIKNIVVNAAFLAAENSGRIHMRHLVRAARREYEKLGRVCTEMEFAPYQAMLRDDAKEGGVNGRAAS